VIEERAGAFPGGFIQQREIVFDLATTARAKSLRA